jgi:predicted RNA-binding protein YlqC (UPF0109 family)
MLVEQVEIETTETVDNVIQLKAPEKNMGTMMNKQGKLVQSVYDLQSDLIAGGINKFTYILYMIRLLYGSGKDVNVTLENLIEMLNCDGVTPLGAEKKIQFEIADVQVELAKMSKKGLLTSYEVPIQLNITSL